AQGIGKAIALRLAQDGFNVALNDLPTKEDQLQVVLKEITSIGRECTIVVADISSEEQVEGMIDNTVHALGSLDVMVANGAPFCQGVSLIVISVEDWDRTFSVNCRGTFLCYRHAAAQMIKQGRGGRIIGASSVIGKQGMPMMGAYCSTKFGIRGLTQVAAQEFGKHGITVNAYAPGISVGVLPNGIEGVLALVRAIAFNVNGMLITALQIKERTAVGFMGEPADIANFVGYMASPESRFVTGKYSTASVGPLWLTNTLLGQTVRIESFGVVL
ncbi:NAD(P)-binding protein, partial [Hymenopellis radicata]